MRVEDAKFSVAVIATMSAGKSTTLNALLGIPLLPAKNEACTAILTKIEDVDGLADVRARVITKNGTISEWGTIAGGDNSLLSQWNTSENQCIEIQGDFPHIDNHSRKIEFIDTPGPNNSTDKSHAEITHDIITQSGHHYVVFVMNATQFGVSDERSLLEKLCHEQKKSARDFKVVFVVNKMDELDFEKGEVPSQLIQSIKDYLSAVGFVEPLVIPVMSQLSLEVRQCLNAHRNGSNLPFTPRVQKRIANDIKILLSHFQFYLEALLNSGAHDEYLNLAFDQKRPFTLSESIFLAEECFSAEQLIDVDLLTGIPLLEEMLEVELTKKTI